MRPKQTEHEIQSTILDWLKRKQIFFWRNNTGAFSGTYKGKNRFVRFGTKGAPDIFAVLHGRIIGIEVKAPGNHQSEDQIAFEAGLRKAGGEYILAYSLNDVLFTFES